MSGQISASFGTLSRQSQQSAFEWMEAAVRNIDTMFGAGYAAKHPLLVAGFMQAASVDYGASVLGKVFGNSSEDIAEALLAIARELHDIGVSMPSGE